MPLPRYALAVIAFCAAAAPEAILAAQPEAPAETVAQPSQLSELTGPIETVIVIATTPLPGVGVDIDKIPSNSQSLISSDLTRESSASIAGALNDTLGSVSINDDLVDPFQPDILYRGFEASPVLGTPEGLAVYQNGVRINEAFGDVLNWDLVPSFAIDRTDIISANPVYGLNALGGAVILNMKNGFTNPGGDAELAGGSFGKRSGTFEYGAHWGNFGAYIGGRALEEDGWRQASRDSLRQLYADFSARTDRLTLDLSFTGANNRLFGESATPVQELAVDRSLIFTTPQYNFNQLYFMTLNGSYKFTSDLSVQSNIYYREYRQTVVNGNGTNYAACADGSDALCQDNGATPVTQLSGAPIPDISNGGATPIGENDFEAIRTVSYGGSVQATSTNQILGHDNHAVIGGSIDHQGIDFQTRAELGVITPALFVDYSGYFVNTPENDNGFGATPVQLGALNRYYGFYLTDTFNVTPELAVTASGRYNVALVDLMDRAGTDLTGQNQYSRFNPAIGLTYKILPNLTGYAGYSETNRTPTASEIECSDPAKPCLLPTNLAGDPPTLRQVVAKTYEVGLRGGFSLPQLSDGRFSWKAGLFRTDLGDDIYGISTSLSTGYFQNIGSTRRQGVEASLGYRDDRLKVYLNYSYIESTFQSPLTLNSPQNPFADANGNIQVHPGDTLPGIPRHRLKLGADYNLLPNWSIGGTLNYVSDQYYRGDEANQNGALPGYAVLNLHSTFDIDESIEVFLDIDNALNANYETFGIYADPTGFNAPGVPAGAVTNGPGADNRFQSPAAPVAAYGGVRVRF